MALSNEDKKDVSKAFGKKAAGAVDKATHDRWAADAKRAKGQFDSLRSSGKMGLPSTAPSRWGSNLSTGASKSKALGKKTGNNVPKHYRGNTNSEGGISFGRKPS